MSAVPLPLVALRRPALDLDDYPALCADPTRSDDETIARIWAVPVIREAVRAAHPVLAALAHRPPADPAARRRLAAALTHYANRMTSRPTPFGLMAGVAFAGGGRAGRYAAVGAVAAEPLARRAETDHDQRGRLRVAPHPGLAIGPARVRVAVARPGEAGHRRSVRLTGPLAAALRRAADRPTWAELVAALGAVFPGPVDLDQYVADLVASGLLVTSARPPSSERYPVDRPGVAAALARFVAAGPGEGDAALHAAADALDPHGADLRGAFAIDLRLDADPVPTDLPGRVAAAVAVLQRIAAARPDATGLDRYARAFEGRYGHEEVPLFDLLDPVTGLGPPPGYPDSPWGPAAPETGPDWYDALRRRLVRRAVDGTAEITDEDLAALPGPVRRPVPSCDVFVRFNPAGGPAVLGPRGCVFPAGRTLARFHALDDRIAGHLADAVALELAASPGVRFAAVDYRYPDPSVGDLTVGPNPYPATVVANGAGAGLPLGDVRVGVDDGRLYLRDRTDGRPLVVRATHVLSLREAPAPVRFVREVSDAPYAEPAFDWGGFLATHDRLPRVTAAGVVVAPARWRGPVGGEPIDQWRRESGVPRYVRTGDRDGRLLLDLDVPAHRVDLVRLASRGDGWVEEAAPALGPDGCPAGRLVEAVVALRDPEPEPLPVPTGAVHATTPRPRLPGDGWWALHLPGYRGLQNDALRALADELAGEEWFFTRYNIPGDHLRVRVRAGVSPDRLAAIGRELCAAELAGGFTIEPYTPESRRFGGDDAVAVVERLHCATTPAVVAALPVLAAAAPLDRIGLGALCAHSYAVALGLSADERHAAWERMAGSAVVPSGRAARRHEHRQRSLLVAALAGAPPPGLGEALAAVARAVIPEAVAVARSGPARDLVHMHLNRLGFGVDAERAIGARLCGTHHAILQRGPQSGLSR